MPSKAAVDKGEKMFSADVVAAVLYSTGTTSLSMKNYEMMSSLDGKKSAHGFQHDFRSVLAKARELKARVESGEEFKPVPSSAKRAPVAPTTPSSTKKRSRASALDEDANYTPSKKSKVKKEATPTSSVKNGLASPKNILDSFPDDAETFIKNEERWEEDIA